MVHQTKENMRGVPKALPLTVNKVQRAILKKEEHKVNIPWAYKERISIVISGMEGKSIYETSRNLGVSLNTVRRWRRRWESGQEELITLEQIVFLVDQLNTHKSETCMQGHR